MTIHLKLLYLNIVIQLFIYNQQKSLNITSKNVLTFFVINDILNMYIDSDIF